MDDLLLFRGNEGDVLSGFLKDLVVVHIDIGERFVEQVPEDGGRLGVLREQQAHALVAGDPGPRALPLHDEGLHFRHKDRGFLALGRRADNSPVVGRKDALKEGLQPLFLFFGRDFLGYADLLCKGKQHDVASCQ